MLNSKQTVKKTIRLFVGEAERLAEYYPQHGYTAAIRALVHRHLRALDAKADEQETEDDKRIDFQL